MRNRDWRLESNGLDDSIRAADADREAVADSLRKYHVEGRLTSEEFESRLEQCMSAKTLGELRALITDLPGERPALTRTAGWRHRGPFRLRLLPVLFVLALAFSAAGRHAAWHGGGPRYGFPWLLFLAVMAAVIFARGRMCYHGGRTYRV
jgi:Domain of unknown function (DUF1707)